MKCPHCGEMRKGRVTYTHDMGRWQKRVRECLRCGGRYATVEVTVVDRLLEFLRVWGSK